MLYNESKLALLTMSYSKFKRSEEEYTKIFSTNRKVQIIHPFDNKKLNLILSSESFLSSIKPILEKMLGEEVDNKRVVLIPNGGIGTDKVSMSYQYLEEFTTINNMYLKQLDLDRWPKEVILEAVHSCDVLAFSGGMVSRLITAIDKLGIRKDIVEIVNSGKPVIGFSAGGMLMASSTHFAEGFMGEPDQDVKNLEPLGIVDFEIYPHFEDVFEFSVRELAEDLDEAYTLKGDQALVITEGKLLGIGEPLKIK